MKRKMAVFLFATLVMSLTVESGATSQRSVSFDLADNKKVKVAARRLNVRNGPGKEFKVIGSIQKDEVLDVLGTFGSWYLVHLPDNSVGVVNMEYTSLMDYTEIDLAVNEPVTVSANPVAPLEALHSNENINSQDDKEKLLQLINSERVKNNVPILELDENISFIAVTKAVEMSQKNYFGHTSPTFGSPFAMLKQFGVTYKAMAENIAGNISVENAHSQIMDSENHKINVLNPRFKKVGIGVSPDEKYGKIIVQMYVE